MGLTVALHHEREDVPEHEDFGQQLRSDQRCGLAVDGADDPPKLHVDGCCEEERREQDEDDLHDIWSEGVVGALVAAQRATNVACKFD